MWRPWGRSAVQIHHTSPSSSSPFSCSSFKDIQTLCIDEPTIPSKPSIFHRVRLANSLIRAWSTHLESPTLSDAAQPEPPPQPSISVPGAEQRVVVYFTSLRVVRSTFEDCRAVRSILRGFRVRMDERDLSMDSGFVRELQGMMGEKKEMSLSLPSVFIAGKYIGGAEEVRRLHESGELKKLMEGLPAADSGLCDVCAGHRFVLCDDCDGSRKLYTAKGGFKTCTTCNENGLTRCPSCSCAPF